MNKLMSQKEVKRSQVLDLLKLGSIAQKEASSRLGISCRQVRRLTKRYQEEGLPGLISKKRGVASNRRLSEVRSRQATQLIESHYRDFGPTLACEKLAQAHGMVFSIESVRQLMIRAGYWHPKKGAKICIHPMRERRARFGELIQIDGSPHDWFEGRSERCTLLVFIDDATGALTQLRFAPTETTLGYLHALLDHITQHGVPVALYSDKHSIFRINAKDADPEAETQFSRAARELGIECIHANSPQAKGRVERANQTLQDRLVKEMRLAGINDMASANAWLPGYIAQYNKRFAVAPREAANAHQAYAGSAEALRRTLCIKVTKTLSKSLSLQHKNKLLQIETSGTGQGMRGAKITLHEHFDGCTELLWRARALTYSVMDKPSRQSPVADGKQVNAQVDRALALALARSHSAHKPSANHPWKKHPSVTPSSSGGSLRHSVG